MAVAFTPSQREAIAEVIDRLDVYNHDMTLRYEHRTEPPRRVRVVNKCHLVTHLADILSIGDPTFDREEFYDACGLAQEERYLG